MIGLPEFASLDEFFKFLSGIGAAVIVLTLLSYFGEDWAWYQSLSSKLKQLVALVTSLVLGVVGMVVGLMFAKANPETRVFLNSLFLLIFSIGGFVLVTPAFHALVNKPLTKATALESPLPHDSS